MTNEQYYGLDYANNAMQAMQKKIEWEKIQYQGALSVPQRLFADEKLFGQFRYNPIYTANKLLLIEDER